MNGTGRHFTIKDPAFGIDVALAAISAAVFAAPVEPPAIITKIAGYLAVAGSVMGAVSETAVLNEEE